MNVQKMRTLSRVLLMSFMAVHMITWYVMGIHAIGSVGIEALFSGLSRGFINAGLIFWAAIVISTLLFGRAFCGWFCWFGGYLELVEWSTSKLRVGIPQRQLLHLGAIPFVALGVKVYSSLIENWLESFPLTFTFRLSDVEPWGGQQTGISILITLVMFGPVLLFVFGPRAWCRYLCPIGALVKALGKVGLGRLRLLNDQCMGCGNCNRSCSMQVDVLGELRKHGEVRSSDCIRCFKCTDHCPKGSIGYAFGRQQASLSADAISRAEQSSNARRGANILDLAVGGLWIGIVLFINVLGLSKNAPQEMKVIMAPGLLLGTYGLALMTRSAISRINGPRRG